MSTNYRSTFITIADDSPSSSGVIPPSSATPTIAALQYTLLSERPYELTSDELLFEVHAIRSHIPAEARDAERERFFAKDQACLRASPLAKRYGWGIHHDHEERVALIAVGTAQYDELARRSDLMHKPAMRSARKR